MKNPFSRLLLAIFILFSATPVWAASKQEIDVYVDEALQEFYKQSPAGQKLAQQAKGVLIFPRIYKAGFIAGAEYGEGVLKINGSTVGYYSIAGGSFGFQAGIQRKSEIILFMTDNALKQFMNSKGWEIGVDGSVAIANLGAGGKIDSNTIKEPIIGFVFSNEGLMYNLTLEGAKISKIAR